MSYFKISSQVVDREDLNIYERMCCVVLAKLSQSDASEISMEILAKGMGVDEVMAKGAFFSLKKKGILESKESDVKPGTIIKANQLDQSNQEKILTREQKVQRVIEIIDEKISLREAKIILGFADYDLDRVKAKYQIAKASQFQDKLEILIHELQKKDQKRVIKKDELEDHSIELASFNDTKQTQINTYKINLMKQYNQK